jgi:hypothetical protein
MKKTIYIHIGSPKTATSSIQNVAKNNSSYLKLKGIKYIESVCSGSAHHPLVFDTNGKSKEVDGFWYGNVPRGGAWEALCNEIETSDFNRFLVSSELFFAVLNQPKYIEFIKEQLSSYDIKIICFLRSPDKLYSSFYSQDIKGERQWSKSAYHFYESHQLFSLSYQVRLELWTNVLGHNNIFLLPYEPKCCDPLEQFFNIFNVNVLDLKGVKHQSNQGVGAEFIHIKKSFNTVCQNKSINSNLNAFILSGLKQDTPLKDCKFVNNRYFNRARIQWLSDIKFLDEHTGSKFFSTEIPLAKDVKNYHYDRGVIVKFIRFAIKEYLLISLNYKVRKYLPKVIMLLIAKNNVSLRELLTGKRCNGE